MDYNKIGKYIAFLRKKKGLTQQELGSMLYVTDKAVSKWERGLSLPDITILEALADILDTDIYSILQIEKKMDIDVKKLLQEEKIKVKKQYARKVVFILAPFLILIGVVLFQVIPFGYQVIPTRYTHNSNQLIYLGIPKYSFLLENVEDSYAFKSFRGKTVLQSEIKAYLNTLDKLTCNETHYYYDPTTDITFIDYQVDGHLLYNTVSYSVRKGNYCQSLQMDEYMDKIGPLYQDKTLYAEDSRLSVYFNLDYKYEENKLKWIAHLYVYYDQKLLEDSSGVFEIQKDLLTYYRTDISSQDEKLEIPNISSFVIKDQKLILKDNYLKQYEKSIILK